jgi:hypothetical protein
LTAPRRRRPFQIGRGGRLRFIGPCKDRIVGLRQARRSNITARWLPARRTTAIIATVGALFSYMGGATQANAGLFKNNAAIKKTEASNQWNYYQAKSSKQNLAELAVVLAPEDRRAGYRDEVDRYKKEKAEIKAAAEKLEAESTDWDRQSDEQMHVLSQMERQSDQREQQICVETSESAAAGCALFESAK